MQLKTLQSRLKSEGLELTVNKKLSNTSFTHYETFLRETKISFMVCSLTNAVIRIKNTIKINGKKGVAYPKSLKKALEIA